MGIDSLMAVELQIGIEVAFGVEISALELTGGASIRQLTQSLLERMGLSSSSTGDEFHAVTSNAGPETADSRIAVDVTPLFVPPPQMPSAGQYAN
jgi:hypothetical protein